MNIVLTIKILNLKMFNYNKFSNNKKINFSHFFVDIINFFNNKTYSL